MGEVSNEFSGLPIQAQVHYLLGLQGKAKQSFTKLAELYMTTPKFSSHPFSPVGDYPVRLMQPLEYLAVLPAVSPVEEALPTGALTLKTLGVVVKG